MIFCENCGKQLNDIAKFCSGCGTKTGSGLNYSIRESTSLFDAVKVACLNCSGSKFKEIGGKKFCIFCGTEYLTQADVEVNMAGRKAEAIVKGFSKGIFDAGASIINKVESSKRSRAFALILSLFLGVWGAHHFYLGYFKKGIIFIVMSVTLIGLIITFPWSIVDVVRIATGSYKPKNGEYE